MQTKEMMIATGSVRMTTRATWQMEEEDGADDAHGDGEFYDLILEGIDRPVYEV